jgi:hypothetical protein
MGVFDRKMGGLSDFDRKMGVFRYKMGVFDGKSGNFGRFRLEKGILRDF